MIPLIPIPDVSATIISGISARTIAAAARFIPGGMFKESIRKPALRLYMTLKMNIFFAVLGISCILLSGCSSLQGPPNTPVPSATPSPIPDITVQMTESPTPSPIATPAVIFTEDQVSQLFIDIAFGCDSIWINKFTPSPNKHLFFSLEGLVNPEDTEFVTQFAKNYNLITPVAVFTDDPLSSKGSPIIIYPSDSLNSLDKTYIGCQETDPNTGALLYLIYKPVVEYPGGQKEETTKIYINSDVEGAQRNHYLERAMLYYLGFPGQTYDYPDSVFYYASQSNVDFIPLDSEAMKTMYGPGIYSGMSVQEARWLLLNE